MSLFALFRRAGEFSWARGADAHVVVYEALLNEERQTTALNTLPSFSRNDEGRS